MTLKEVYRKILLQAQTIYPLSEATNITDWIFENVADVTRADVIKTPNLELSFSILDELDNRLHQLLLHKPIQYILGESWFYNMKLKVNDSVLIPRPETEELVDHIIQNAKEIYSNLNILDIGTGSGCISIALKKHLPVTAITAIDFSEAALIVAKENSLSQNANIQFIHFDFLAETNWITLPKFDIIVSNPPYIPDNEKAQLDKNVTSYEPHSALFVPTNKPLLFYEKIAKFGITHLKENGKVYMETHEDFSKETAALFSASNYKSVAIKKDIFGKERFVIASLGSAVDETL